MELSKEEALPRELRDLVQESGAILGRVIRREAGERAFELVESLRSGMAGLRDQGPELVADHLRRELGRLQRSSPALRHTVGKAFTFFLELMNSCENAYRSLRLKGKEELLPPRKTSTTLIYVLTPHPPAARAPENIAIFQGAQQILLEALEGGSPEWREDLFHQLELAWRAYPTRQKAPRVKDEAAHIYGTSLNPTVLKAVLKASHEIAPFFLRTWVGGDKDGHPGVDEKAMKESLALSRAALLGFLSRELRLIKKSLRLLPQSPLVKKLLSLEKTLSSLKALKAGDGARVEKAKKEFFAYSAAYEKELGAPHSSLREIKRLLYGFPGLTVPLELRESSDVITDRPVAISRMLGLLARLAKGGDPRWYARGFIVSMTETVEHLAAADALVRKAFGRPALPVIPLFETVPALEAGPSVLEAVARHPRLGKSLEAWNRRFEIMVGYSDSSKQGGVFPSRLAIASAMHRMEQVALASGIRPIFFQGSGGSVDRGGGSVQDQVAWWPRSALEIYKVTVQGEMVERSFSSPEITRGQILRIAESVGKALAERPRAPAAPVLFRFADLVREAYQQKIGDEAFLELVGKGTPYPFLSELKIGSRPTRRAKSVTGLRAIPWVLCWTQTRVLFPTWWGVGKAWAALKAGEREELRLAFRKEPVFTSYVKALGFTLAKVELPLWQMYLERSGLGTKEIAKVCREFTEEFQGAWELLRFCSGSENPLWFRPWLGASIRLRAPMIHPLNLLQVIAMEEEDYGLFRTTATGISAGMMTTG